MAHVLAARPKPDRLNHQRPIYLLFIPQFDNLRNFSNVVASLPRPTNIAKRRRPTLSTDLLHLDDGMTHLTADLADIDVGDAASDIL